jgi:cardiolipin synthase
MKAAPMARPARAALFFSVFAALSMMGGCSSLPDVQELIRDFHLSGNSLTILGARGALPQEKRAKALSRLRDEGGSAGILEKNLEIVETVGGTPVFCGNRATLLVDGDMAFAAMLDVIDSARDHVNFETYIIKDDDVGRRFADLLLKKRAEGVTVNLIYDGFGCRGTPMSFFDRLKEGGVNTLEFNPISFGRVRGYNAFYHRTHRKMLIVDGTVAFAGGINIGTDYLKSRPPRDRISPPFQFWRDTHIMIEGPAVAAFQEIFLHTWLSQAGAPPMTARYFPPGERRGDQMVQVVDSTPGYAHRGSYVMYVSAVTHAQKSVHMTQSYFVPDKQMMQALVDAAQRGVDVRIILPGCTDHGIVRQAGRRHYQELLDAGVRLYERAGVVLHSKTAVIDGVWSTVGSTNLELWSFVTSDEVNAVVIGSRFADDMEASFQKDLAQSREILPDEWSRRPLVDRVKEFLSNLFHYWL